MTQLLLDFNILPEYKYECIDALDFCRKIPDETVKLIITSPPYNIGKSYETKINIQDYIKNFESMISEFVRILSNDGSICWQTGNFVEDGEIYPLDIYFYPVFKKYGLKLRNRIIWHFGHGLHCTKRFSGRYENILWFTKSDEYTFNLDDVRIPSKYPGKKYFKGAKKGTFSGNPKGKNPEDVWEMTLNRLYEDWDDLIWEIPNVKNNHPEKLAHPCQYPVELAERCILALTNENDIVYDPFVGVGSTLVAALKNNRKAWGSEREKNFVDIGLERLQKLREGTLSTRPIYQKIWTPSANDSIAQKPSEWK
ncbi:MAG: site-specific DNA-methyltransferase [Synergistaceae bacterium]|nr:site-specific DNA-methyltransferase [Synergistaceae bacterium]MBQ7067601.1 site-specific DNA-methyltransferase [Synergistaceae bacterium]MBR0076476.1 site-specific DNA-methyltransferase [Synergistaceae bacterium]MBR0080157.1 site-specific DNA-methyltransferase [Synergistaceae bacterium]MBR0253435.1 site-specific DNA-methyltransferase [Synergistaceae bacterium]